MKGDKDGGKASTRPGGPKCRCCATGKTFANRQRRRESKKVLRGMVGKHVCPE